MSKEKMVVKKEPADLKLTGRDKQLKRVMLEINTNRIEDSIRQTVDQVQYWYRQGIIRKVRLKYRGKAILPDIPISYFMLVQVATFFLTGVVRALALNLGAKIFFEVEMVNDAEELLKRARELYLDGELDEALKLLKDVVSLDGKYAEAYLYMGIISKIKKDQDAAAGYFEHARRLGSHSKAGMEAAKHLKKLQQ